MIKRHKLRVNGEFVDKLNKIKTEDAKQYWKILYNKEKV